MFFFKSTILTNKLRELYVKNLLRMCILQVKSYPTENFKIYSASAGSGKTYQLTKAYLKLILRPGSHQRYRQLLAITFTNKAVAEMKQRILDNLYNFSQENMPEKSVSLFNELAHDLSLSHNELRKNAKHTLKELLHNYAFFEVSTIDKFNHKIIRTFAQDLKISQSFEVILDTHLLLEEAVFNLLSKTGNDPKLTRVLLDFALDKIDSDKSWDIAYDLFEIGKLIFLENHYYHLKEMQDKAIEDFLALQSKLKANIKTQEKIIKESADLALGLMDSNDLSESDFYAGYFPKFLKAISEGNFDSNFNAAWKQNFEQAQLYKKNAPAKDRIEALHPKFSVLFNAIKETTHKRDFLRNCLNNIVPLTLLTEISKQLKAIQYEKDVLPISDFNTLIAQEIKDQPVPFIYERLGEKYRHYFVDEFQDTSLMQWQNLIPLISNALESENEKGEKGSLLLVGDVKQAIYRWRGGRAEQFLNLLNLRTNPFSVPPKVNHLETNWRSHREIVDFNNRFFTHIAPKLSNSGYQKIFEEGNGQKPNAKNGGYVELAFVDNPDTADAVDPQCLKVRAIIDRVLEMDHDLGDIAILVRDNKKAALMADFLAQHDIPVISPDSLLLANNEKVLFLVSFLTFLENGEDKNAIYDMLHFISDTPDSHDFITERLHNFEEFLFAEYKLKADDLKGRSAYEVLEIAISKFDLVRGSDAYVTQFLDEVFEVGRREGLGISTLLKYWNVNGDKLSVAAPDALNAIKVMTIHKAKGLEFPIVIFPFADSKIIDSRGKKLWVDVPADSFLGFEKMLLNFGKGLSDYSPNVVGLYHDELVKLELDAFNVLYVAMTRAIKSLFVITTPPKGKGDSAAADYSNFFKDFLASIGLWQESQTVYSFGRLASKDGVMPTASPSVDIPYRYTQKQLYDSKIIANADVMLDSRQVDAIYLGDLFHQAMAYIETETDIGYALERIKRQNEISLEHLRFLESKIAEVVHHPDLRPYFSMEAGLHLNEKEILAHDGNIIRPDKIILKENGAVLIDYKTGHKKSEHIAQITYYSEVLKAMGHQVEKQILVYVDDESIQPQFI